MGGLQASTNFLVTEIDAIKHPFDLLDVPGVDDPLTLMKMGRSATGLVMMTPS
jgi:hypothetical protein